MRSLGEDIGSAVSLSFFTSGVFLNLDHRSPFHKVNVKRFNNAGGAMRLNSWLWGYGV